MVKQIANIITACRVLGSILLFFFPAFSAEFYVIYILCGFSDMIDGTIARMTNSAGGAGAKLDTAADLAFVAAALIKILPVIDIPPWLWLWGGVIAIIKTGNIAWGFAFKKQFVSLHTPMNKLAGLLLFLSPLTLSFAKLKYSFVAVCSIATFAALQETVYITAACKNRQADFNL